MVEVANSRLFTLWNTVGPLALAIAMALPCAAFSGESDDPIGLELRKSQHPIAAELDRSGTTASPGSDSIDWEALNWDPWSLTSPDKQRTWQPAKSPAETPASWDHKVNADGSSALTVKKRLPTALETKVGVDVGLAPPDSNRLQPERMLSASPTNSGAAWANMSVPGASIDARLDPRQEQAKLGTKLKKSVPLNRNVSVSLENGYSVTDTFATSNTVDPVPGMMTLPVATTPAAAPTPSRIYSTDGTARLTIAPSGTTLLTGTQRSSTDEKWRRSVGAEQHLFGGVNVTGKVTETDGGALDKSITAGFKTSW